MKVVLKLKKTASDKKKSNRGRKRTRAFEFGMGIELRASHKQQLRTKICTLKLYKNPPPFPGKEPKDDVDLDAERKWKQKADRFAEHFLILFRPEEDLYEEGQVNDYAYNWDAFIKFKNELKTGSTIQQ